MELFNTCSPLLSIVIATRNRVPYAISAIKSILEIPDARLELVVQDNSDSRDLETYINDNIVDARFRYRYTSPPFSMIDNFNAAVELATGEYLCIIGDDDGVNPEIMEAAAWAKSERVDALAARLTVNYLWRGTGLSSGLFTKNTGASLSISGFQRKLVYVDIENGIRNLLHNGGVYYMHFDLPKLYHGLVHRRCLEAIHKKTGTYFGGLSPDIFASMAIACVANNLVITDYPLTIPGVCPGSGGTYKGKSASNTKLEDTFLWRDRGEYQWCELVPRVFTAETVWVDSGVAALHAMGRDDLVMELNLTKLAAYCIGANQGIAKSVMHDMFKGLQIMGKSRLIGVCRFGWSMVTGPGAKFALRIWNRFLIITGSRVTHKIDGLENMEEASHALVNYLKERGYCFSDCVHLRNER